MMRCTRSLLALIVGLPMGLGAALPVQALAVSSDEPTSGQNATQPGDDGRRIDPQARERLRELLRKRIEWQRKEIERLEAIAKAMDEGKSFDEIRESMPEVFRSRSGGMREFAEFVSGRNEGGERTTPDVDRLGPSPMPPSPGSMDGRRGERRGHGERQGQTDARRPLTAEDRQAIRDFLSATSPSLHNKLVELEKQDPAEAERKFAEAMPRLRFILEQRARDPEMYALRLNDIKLGRESLEAARAVAESEGKGVDPNSRDHQKKVETLRVALERQYDHRTQILQLEAAKTKDRAEKSDREIAKRPERRNEIVSKNLREMIERERKRMEKASEGDRLPQPDPGQ